MANIEIRHRSTGAVLYAGDGESVLEVVEAAVQGGADLYGADLRGADLRGANLGEAKLGGADLVGSRPVMQIGPIGSRADYLIAVVTTDGVRVTAGCFSGTLDGFRAAVESTHGDSEHGRDYRAAIAMIKAHAEIWAHAAAEVA